MVSSLKVESASQILAKLRRIQFYWEGVLPRYTVLSSLDALNCPPLQLPGHHKQTSFSPGWFVDLSMLPFTATPTDGSSVIEQGRRVTLQDCPTLLKISRKPRQHRWAPPCPFLWSSKRGTIVPCVFCKESDKRNWSTVFGCQGKAGRPIWQSSQGSEETQ